MNIDIFLRRASVVVLIAVIGLNLSATNVDINKARLVANGFLKQHVGTPGSIQSPKLSDLKLAHAEVSSVNRNANAYYAFNVNGGGFVIVAGDDRASQVLGYSDQGQLDFKHMPDNLKELLNYYKAQIEYLQANPEVRVPKRTINNRGIIVEPLIQAHWGQQMPYYLQCPVYEGEYCKVGCSGVQMAQIAHYWQFPVSCGPIAAYYCSTLGVTLPELPPTTFDYSKMLTSYCHYDFSLKEVIQDTYTDEQVYEVAKLCRYVGQAAKMTYKPAGSGSTGERKLAGMKTLGFNPDAISVTYADDYTTESWESLMRAELDASRPIMYGAKNATSTSASHAFIFDGYDSDGYFHINLGWYGFNDGWFLTTAIITTYLDGSYRNYSKEHYMFLDMRPPYYYTVNAQSIDADDEFFLLGGLFNTHATDVNIYTSYDAVDLVFTITDVNGNIVAASDTINVLNSEFTQHSDINSAIVLPASLPEGTYFLQFNYIADNELNTVVSTQSQLFVSGRLAKFGSTFSMDDLTSLINILLTDKNTQLNMDDLTGLINYLLTH